MPPVFTDAPAVRDQLSRDWAGEPQRAEPAAVHRLLRRLARAVPGPAGRRFRHRPRPATGVVSTSRGLLNSKDLDGPANPTVIAFAVADTVAACAGAVIYGYPKTDKSMKIDSPAPCNAQGVVTAFKARFPDASTANHDRSAGDDRRFAVSRAPLRRIPARA